MRARILLRKERVNKDGTSPLALRAELGQKKIAVLGLGGMRAKPDELNAKGLFKSGSANASDKNLILQQALAKANDIMVKSRLTGSVLTPASFKAEWESGGGSTDFICWSEVELARQYRVNGIGEPTHRLYKNVLKKLRKFTPEGLPFGSITKEWLEEFDSWHQRQVVRKTRTIGNGHTARMKALKSIRRFLYIAIRQGVYKGKNPFLDYKVPPDKRTITWLGASELRSIRELYNSGQFVHELRPFLFSCYTGLRFSDVAGLLPEHIDNGRIRKTAVKNQAKLPKALEIPLTRQAREMLEQGGLPLCKGTDQHINRTLKIVAETAGINKRLTFHVARHTFATLFLEAGGAVEVLKELLGHSSLVNTMIYVHVAGERKTSQMELMERMLGGG